MSQESEDLLSKRVVNYLRNEALVGRINSKKLKVNNPFLSDIQLYQRTRSPTLFTFLIILKKDLKKYISLSKRKYLR